MPESIAVVKPYYAAEEAYRSGYERFEDHEVPEGEEPTLEYFTDSATYANHVLPNLRAMAGFADSGPGTYTVGRKVATVNPGCEEDTPAEAVLRDARDVFSRLVDAWRAGAYDAMEGRDPDPDRVDV